MTVSKKSVFIALVTAIIVMFTAVCAAIFGMGGLTFNTQAQERNEDSALLSQDKVSILKDSYAQYLQLPSVGEAMAMSIGETQEDNMAIIQTYPLYDFSGNLIAYCAVFDSGYSIINAVTDTVYETGAVNPYEGYTDNKLIYVSPTVYGYQSNGGYYLTSSDSKLNEAAITHLQNAWEDLQLKEMQDIGEDERIQTMATSSPDTSRLHFVYSGATSNIAKGLYFFLLTNANEMFDDDDLLFPLNNGSSCATVAMTMLLQFYERNGIIDLIPDQFYSSPGFDSKDFRHLSKTQRLHDYLYEHADKFIAGSVLSDKIVELFNWYFNNFGYNAKATYKALYSGMSSSILDNRPAIGEIVNYEGYLWNISNDTFSSYRVTNHQVIVFGFTVKSSGFLDSFVINLGWSGFKPMIISKSAFFANTIVDFD